LIGIGLVVFVVAGTLMLSDGVKKTLGASGSPDRAIVIRKGSDAEMTSSIEVATAGLILDMPGVKRDSGNKALGAGEIVTVITLDKADKDGEVSNVMVRGVADNVMALRPEAHIVAGRPAKPGTDEVIVGARIVGNFKGLELGKSFELKKNRPVLVVGIFEAGGSAAESEVWADVDTVRSSFGREGLVTSVTVTLDSPAKYLGFEAAVENDKRLGLDVLREVTYYEKQSEATGGFVTILGFVISFFFLLAAIIGAFITMNTAIAQRQREIGTMRALGFSRWAVLLSFLIECIVLTTAGAVVGLLAAFFLTFKKIAMMNFATWSEIVFSFSFTPGVVFTAIIVGGIAGLIGGILPAWRAAKLKPIDALRA
jgi:putative ABC transport system permease protein